MTTFHLNLLNQADQKAPKDERKRIFSMIVASFVLLAICVWCGFIAIQYSITNGRLKELNAKIGDLAKEEAECEALKAKLTDQQSESDQQDYYLHGRQVRGELLKKLAYAMPEGVTLSAMAIPEPPDQGLRRPPGSILPPRQGPTGTTERVELRLTGLATREQDVFQLMQALEGESFTGLVVIVKSPEPNEQTSPRVLAFRQEAPAETGRRNVFFDLVYDLNPREFVK